MNNTRFDNIYNSNAPKTWFEAGVKIASGTVLWFYDNKLGLIWSNPISKVSHEYIYFKKLPVIDALKEDTGVNISTQNYLFLYNLIHHGLEGAVLQIIPTGHGKTINIPVYVNSSLETLKEIVLHDLSKQLKVHELNIKHETEVAKSSQIQNKFYIPSNLSRTYVHYEVDVFGKIERDIKKAEIIFAQNNS